MNGNNATQHRENIYGINDIIWDCWSCEFRPHFWTQKMRWVPTVCRTSLRSGFRHGRKKFDHQSKFKHAGLLGLPNLPNSQQFFKSKRQPRFLAFLPMSYVSNPNKFREKGDDKFGQPLYTKILAEKQASALVENVFRKVSLHPSLLDNR